MTSVDGQESPSGEIDLRVLGRALKRRRRAYIVPAILAFVLIGIYVNVVSKRYTAQAQLLLENQETFFTRPDRVNLPNDQSNQLDETAVSSQVQLINSPDLARRAIAQLNLVGNSEFDPRASANPVSHLLSLLGVLPSGSKDGVDARMVDKFLQNLTVFSPTKTRVITVEFTSRDPLLAARAANTIAELYIAEQSAAKRAMAQSAAEALGAQIDDLRTKLAKADADRETYRSTSGLLAGQNNMTISGQQLADINSDLSKARSIQADAQAKASMIRELLRNGQGADVADVTNNDIVRRLWDQRAVAQAQLALESRTLLPQHPRIKELTAQVAQYDAALKSAAKQAATTLENEALIAGQRVTNLEALLTQQKRAVGVSNGDEIHLRALERIAQGYKDQLESSTIKYEEALARETSTATPADARLIARAQPPHQASFPKKIPFVIFGTIAVLVFSILYVIASELLSGRANVSAAVAPLTRMAEPRVVQPVVATSSVANSVASPVATNDTVDASREPERSPRAESVAGESALRSREKLQPFRDTRTAPLGQAMLKALSSAHDDESAKPDLPDQEGQPRREGRGLAGSFMAALGFMRVFGQSAAADKAAQVSASGQSMNIDRAAEGNSSSIGEGNLDVLVKRIVEAHVPGRGLHVVGSSIGAGDVGPQYVALSRTLAGKGRTLVVDLCPTPLQLAPLCEDADGADKIKTLPGLSELLSGNAGFAEVIHRDYATRLHFIPAGIRDADFRDFDLVLDALSETYDFVVLLTPASTESEIAKVMAPYADFVVLTTTDDLDGDVERRLRMELTEAGAREILLLQAHDAVAGTAQVA